MPNEPVINIEPVPEEKVIMEHPELGPLQRVEVLYSQWKGIWKHRGWSITDQPILSLDFGASVGQVTTPETPLVDEEDDDDL